MNVMKSKLKREIRESTKKQNTTTRGVKIIYYNMSDKKVAEEE